MPVSNRRPWRRVISFALRAGIFFFCRLGQASLGLRIMRPLAAWPPLRGRAVKLSRRPQASDKPRLPLAGHHAASPQGRRLEEPPVSLSAHRAGEGFRSSGSRFLSQTIPKCQLQGYSPCSDKPHRGLKVLRFARKGAAAEGRPPSVRFWFMPAVRASRTSLAARMKCGVAARRVSAPVRGYSEA